MADTLLLSYRDRWNDSLEKLVGRYSMTRLEIQLAPLLEDRVESKVAISVAASSISVTKIEEKRNSIVQLVSNTIVFFSSFFPSFSFFFFNSRKITDDHSD